MNLAKRCVVFVAACVGVALVFSTGCSGYRVESAYRGDVVTVAVPIWENATFDYGLETQLTDALIKEIHRTTPYKVVANPAADTALTGAIRATDLAKLVGDSDTGLVQELGYTITVDFEWKRSRDGEVLVARRGYQGAGSFVPDRDASERIEMGQRRAVDRLAKSIVAELRSGW